MPELPEVEVVKKSLKKIVCLRIKSIEINSVKLRYKLDKTSFLGLINKKILSVKRVSKFILINFSNKKTLIIHLGMTGKFYIMSKNGENLKPLSFYYGINKNNNHDHIIIILEKKLRLIYNDVRRFGFFKVVWTKDIKKNKHLSKLGPEPLSEKFNFNYFKKKIINKKKKIKDLLMDQRFVSGLGNIYVNEILFLSKIKPFKISNKIKDKNIVDIVSNTKKILKKSIKLGGSSIKDFTYNFGTRGNFQQKFKVYGRNGLKCLNINCTGFIKKRIFSNRSSYYCDYCQK
tara:strand:+ start:1270 stop:2133 length:864 start_codon:yes stop_codon:yes gene_type:complete